MKRNKLTRRRCLGLSLATGAAILGRPAAMLQCLASEAGETAPIRIGSRRELFVDDFLIDRLTGAELKLHKPQPREVVLECDAPWEGNTSAYCTFFRDGDRFRAYYRGSHHDEKTGKPAHPEVACYAESKDGLAWTKPKLGVCEFAGSKDNNIIWTGDGSHNFTPFKDANPACAPEARYKALARGRSVVGDRQAPCLNAFQSADGIRWTLLKEAVTTAGAFDSQNLAFWDAERGHYRAYWRIFKDGVRAIRTAVSPDFLQWAEMTDLAYVDSPAEHLYTNAVMPYFRAPHLFIGLPTRFKPQTQQVEPVFMTSRDGIRFRRWNAELIPITAPQERDGNRSNYLTWGLLQRPGNQRELSVYATEAYYKGPASRVRRFTFRTDGFVSVHAPKTGTLVTKPFVFSGSKLTLNLVSRGPSRIEMQGADGRPLPGFRAQDNTPLQGDFMEAAVAWKDAALDEWAGKPVRLRFELAAADLFSMKFE